jgi:hypothetical protein
MLPNLEFTAPWKGGEGWGGVQRGRRGEGENKRTVETFTRGKAIVLRLSPSPLFPLCRLRKISFKKNFIKKSRCAGWRKSIAVRGADSAVWREKRVCGESGAAWRGRREAVWRERHEEKSGAVREAVRVTRGGKKACVECAAQYERYEVVWCGADSVSRGRAACGSVYGAGDVARRE